MEALHGFEVFAVDVGFAETQAAGDVEGFIQIGGIDGAGQAELAVVCQSDDLVECAKVATGRTGPKVSSFMMSMLLSVSVSRVGSKK